MKAYRIFSRIYFLITVTELFLLFFNPFGMPFRASFSQILYIFILGLYILKSSLYSSKRVSRGLFFIFKFPEFTLVFTMAFFLFSYIFASNANMDYVQRFISMGGKLNLAIDTHVERSLSAMEFVPLLVLNIVEIIYMRVKYFKLSVKLFGRNVFSRWALFWTFLSVLLFSFSFPSFLNLNGYSVLAWLSLVPLYLVLYNSSYLRGVFYGTSFGVLQVLITNYWLGTFQLISLQFVTFFFLIYYFLFMFLINWLFKEVLKSRGKLKRMAFLIYPVSWILFDYLRSSGFLGYPWGMLGVTQYRFIHLIQIASVTGIWGISLVVLLANSMIAEVIVILTGGQNRKVFVKAVLPATLFFVIFGFSIMYGYLTVGKYQYDSGKPGDSTVKVALIQQNTDPRKNDYEDTFNKLKVLTNEAMKSKPDIVVWSETAFVPNIRRWSKLDPKKYPLARLVKEFLAYQKSLGVWLLTGNDDYLLVDGKRYDYNASVLFSPDGKRMQTYHKIKLVPFTEYFPYKRQLPFIYNLLVNFDVYLWEPGTERVVFHHPKFDFSTPICFEDAFPDEIRQFVRSGADVIMNISNDYWSLTKVEAKQHFVNAIFRAVENRRPLLRSTASGVTAHVNPAGVVLNEAPYYKETYLITDVAIKDKGFSIYARYGDYLPLAMIPLLLFFLSVVLVQRIKLKG